MDLCILNIARNLCSENEPCYDPIMTIASHIIISGRKEDAIKKYPGMEKNIEFFSKKDPSKKLKYLDWQLSILESEQAPEQEIQDVTELFEKYGKNLENKDIYKYQPDKFTELRDELFEMRDKSDSKRGKAKDKYQINEKCEYNIIYDSDKFNCLNIKNKAASVHYGQGTKWCVTMKNEKYFEQYDSNNNVFFFINTKGSDKENPLYKIACNCKRDKYNIIIEKFWWNSLDNKISESKVNKYLGEEFDQIYQKIDQTASNYPKSELAKLSSNELSTNEMTQLYQRSEGTIKEFIEHTLSEDEDCPPEILKILIKSKNIDVKNGVAFNQNCPPEILIELSKDNNREIRSTVARNPNCPREILEKLSKDNDDHIRRYVVQNRNCPVNVLNELSDDKDDNVRESVAQKKNCPPDTLNKLSKDKNVNVKVNVAYNPNCPPEILNELSDDDEEGVKLSIINRENCPPETLSILSKDIDVFIRESVARKENCPPDILNELSKDKDKSVRWNVVNNPNCPHEVLDVLSKDENSNVKDAAKNKLKSMTSASR